MSQSTTYQSTLPFIPSVDEVEKRMHQKKYGIAVSQTPPLTRKQKKEMWIQWLMIAAGISIPLTILVDVLIYMIRPDLVVYNANATIQWLWTGILFVVCFIGTIVCRLGASLVK